MSASNQPKSQTNQMPASKAESINCKGALTDHKIIPDEQIKLFCEILQFNKYRGEGWKDEYDRRVYVNRLRPLVHKLKFPLSRPKSLIYKALLPAQSEYTFLCDMHACLNADFVHQWFQILALEVGARMETLRAAGPEFLGDIAWGAIILPLTSLHRIWLDTKQMTETFGHLSGFNSRERLDLARQEDGCEACILSRISESDEILLALLTIIKSRISFDSHARHPSRLRLLRLVDAWLRLREIQPARRRDYRCVQDTRRLQQIYLGLAEELYEKRVELKIHLHRLRRAKRRTLEVEHSGSKTYRQLVKDLEDKPIDDTMYDAENDIIDTYAALHSIRRVSSLLSDVSTLLSANAHPPSPTSGRDRNTVRGSSSYHHNPSPYLPSTVTNGPYLESKYSIDTVKNNTRIVEGCDAALADLESRENTPRKYSVGSGPFSDFYADGGKGLHSTSRSDRAAYHVQCRRPETCSGSDKQRSHPAHSSFTEVDPHVSSTTVWPVFSNGNQVELREMVQQQKSQSSNGYARSRSRSSLPTLPEPRSTSPERSSYGRPLPPLPDHERSATSNFVYSSGNASRYVRADSRHSHQNCEVHQTIASSKANASTSGKSYSAAKLLYPITMRCLQQKMKQMTIESDFEYHSDLSKWSNISVMESPSTDDGDYETLAEKKKGLERGWAEAEQGRQRSSTVSSPGSGYSEYYQRNETREMRRCEDENEEQRWFRDL